MDKILLTTPARFIPPINTIAYRFLLLLSDGMPHTKIAIMLVLGDDPRSARQSLTGETYGCWLIHNLGDKKGVYQLDERHLRGDPELDKDARAIAYRQLKDRSKHQSERESQRYPRALKEQAEAYAMYQERLNFTEEKQPAPKY